MYENNSGIEPVCHRVLILPEEIEEKTKGGIVLTLTDVEKERMAHDIGHVVAVGCTAWADQSTHPGVKVGDKVMFAKYQGQTKTGADGKKYRLINDLDIVAVVREEASHE